MVRSPSRCQASSSNVPIIQMSYQGLALVTCPRPHCSIMESIKKIKSEQIGAARGLRALPIKANFPVRETVVQKKAEASWDRLELFLYHLGPPNPPQWIDSLLTSESH